MYSTFVVLEFSSSLPAKKTPAKKTPTKALKGSPIEEEKSSEELGIALIKF